MDLVGRWRFAHYMLILDGFRRAVPAGRSGRDYATLAAAARGLACRVMIICNSQASLGDLRESERLRIVRNCFHEEYLKLLEGADIVVLPLRAREAYVARFSLATHLRALVAAIGEDQVNTKPASTGST